MRNLWEIEVISPFGCQNQLSNPGKQQRQENRGDNKRTLRSPFSKETFADSSLILFAANPDLAIETILTLRLLFHLPLRQTEGFVSSLFQMMKLQLPIPDHTTLSRRSQTLKPILHGGVPGCPLHLIVDSTGLSIHGEGPWASGKKRRTFQSNWKTVVGKQLLFRVLSCAFDEHRKDVWRGLTGIKNHQTEKRLLGSNSFFGSSHVLSMNIESMYEEDWLE